MKKARKPLSQEVDRFTIQEWGGYPGSSTEDCWAIYDNNARIGERLIALVYPPHAHRRAITIAVALTKEP